MSKSKTIMIADDDPAILEALSLMLEEEGYNVSTSTDGSKIRNLTDNFPDLLLLDIWMSGVNGQDICRELKENVLTKQIPIIMISANRDTEKIAKEVGADDFIAKPFEMTELFNKIRKYTN